MLRGFPLRKHSFPLLLVLSFLNKLSLCFTSCDVPTCNSHVQNLLSHNREDGTATLSRHIKDFLKCIGECYHDLFPNFVPKFEDSLNVSEKIFSSDPIFYLNDNWECVAQNSVPLVTCLAVAQSMKTSLRNGKASRLLACKKGTAVLNCPQEILLEKCGETTAEAMDEIFSIALKSEIANACQGVSSGALSNLHTYNKLGNKFMKMATCVDIQMAISKNCLQEFLMDSYAVRKYICCEYDDLTRCMIRDSDDCISMFANVSFFRNMLSLGEDQCSSVEGCPQDNSDENKYNFEDRSNSDLVAPSTQAMNLFPSETAAGSLKTENLNTPVTKLVNTIHENNTQPPFAYTILSNTTFALSEVQREENNTKKTNRMTFPPKHGAKAKIEKKNTSTNENTRFTSTSVSTVPYKELVSSRTIPSPCAKVKVDTMFVLLLLSISIFH